MYGFDRVVMEGYRCQEFWTTSAGVHGTLSIRMFQLRTSLRVCQGR